MLHDVLYVQNQPFHLNVIAFPQAKSTVAATAEQATDPSGLVVVVYSQPDCYRSIAADSAAPTLPVEHFLVLSRLQSVHLLDSSIVRLGGEFHTTLRSRGHSVWTRVTLTTYFPGRLGVTLCSQPHGSMMTSPSSVSLISSIWHFFLGWCGSTQFRHQSPGNNSNGMTFGA